MAAQPPPISNWVVLVPGREKRLHFSDHRIVERAITDPWTHQPKVVQSILFWVDFEDGNPVSKSFSVISQRLAGELTPYLENKRYVHFAFRFYKEAPGTVAPRLARAEPWLGR